MQEVLGKTIAMIRASREYQKWFTSRQRNRSMDKYYQSMSFDHNQ